MISNLPDQTVCPICKDSLKNKRLSHWNSIPGNFISRECADPINHFLYFIAENNNIIFIKFSINETYSRIISIDYLSNSSEILMLKNNSQTLIKVPKLLIPDFPNLLDLKSKIDIYANFI